MFSDGVKEARRYIVANADGKSATVIPIQSSKGGHCPGWVPLAPLPPLISVPSLITLNLMKVETSRLADGTRSNTRIPAETAMEFLDNVRVMLGLRMEHNKTRQSFVWHLAPPSIRAMGKDSRSELDLLKTFTWVPPRQGELYRIPAMIGRTDPSEYVLVISSDNFNTRFRYMDVVLVRVAPESGSSEENIPIEIEKPQTGATSTRLFAKPQSVHTVSFSRNWFDRCARCVSKGAGYHSWQFEDTLGVVRCLSCDKDVLISSQFDHGKLWLQRNSMITKQSLKSVTASVISYLETHLEQQGG